jgi:putative hydrolase of the HAD superfamily
MQSLPCRLLNVTISGVLLDWGGVFTVGNFHRRLIHRLAEQFGVEVGKVEQAYRSRQRRIMLGEWSLSTFWANLSAALGIWAPIDTFETIFVASVAPRWEMYELLQALPPELRVGMLSNNFPVVSDYLRAEGSFERFDAVVFSNEVGAIKPEPRIFEIALERMELPASEILFVDDSPANLKAAATLGFQTHLFGGEEELVWQLERSGLVVRV